MESPPNPRLSAQTASPIDSLERTLIASLPERSTVSNDTYPLKIAGRVTNIRNKGGVAFIDITDRTGIVQAVIESGGEEAFSMKRNDIVALYGTARPSEVRQGIPGVEFAVTTYQVLSSPEQEYPIPVTSAAQIKLEKELDHRAISVRNPKNNLVFKVESDVAKHLSEFLRERGFTQIFTPKIVPRIAESGANMFRLQYFGRDAFLTQSPQFYKQLMAGSGLERVFEVAPVFRAEKHDTSRHLNEYISLDLEMAYIQSYSDLMDFEQELLKHVYTSIKRDHGDAIKQQFGVEVNPPEKIPRFTLREALARIKEHYNYAPKEPDDLDPKCEKLITRFAQENYGSEFAFITQYPVSIRPFYAMPNKEDPAVTDSFDLIYRGLEITTGGQRIHNHQQLLDNLARFGLSSDGIEQYLSAFKYGMPPHGGMGIGLERVTSRLLGLDNVKAASAFPRDIRRIEP